MTMRALFALTTLIALAACGNETQPPAQAATSSAEAGINSQAASAPEQETAPQEQVALPPVNSEPPYAIEEAAAESAREAEAAEPQAAEPETAGTIEQAEDDADSPGVSEASAPPVVEPARPEEEPQDPDRTAEPPPAEEEQPEQAQAPEDPVVTLLDRLESSAADLRTFTADVLYQTEDALLGQKVSRRGSIAYAVDAGSKQKKFAIRFNQIIESGRMRSRDKHYIFNDRWLVEIDEAEKTFIKREIVPPGSTFDPLKLGEGPFPLPIGQARREVLARFEVELIELPQDGALAGIREKLQVHGLRLRPRQGTAEAEDYDRIDLFYDQGTLLPAGVEVIESNGDRKTARLENLRRNPDLRDDFSVAEPDPTVWRIDVRPWQDRP